MGTSLEGELTWRDERGLQSRRHARFRGKRRRGRSAEEMGTLSEYGVRIQGSIESNRWAQVTAREPSPTAKPTRFVEPERISPAARTPGSGVSRGHGSRSLRGHIPERMASPPVSR